MPDPKIQDSQISELIDQTKGGSNQLVLPEQEALNDFPEMRSSRILSEGGPLCLALKHGCEAVSVSLSDMWMILDMQKNSEFGSFNIHSITLRHPSGRIIDPRFLVADFTEAVANHCSLVHKTGDFPISLDDVVRILCAVMISPTGTWTGEVCFSTRGNKIFSEQFQSEGGRGQFSYDGAGKSLLRLGNLIAHLTKLHVSTDIIIKINQETLSKDSSDETLDELIKNKSFGVSPIPFSPQPFGTEFRMYSESNKRSAKDNSSEELIENLVACGVAAEISRIAFLETPMLNTFVWGLEHSLKNADLYPSSPITPTRS